jgi:hypothetical protein
MFRAGSEPPDRCLIEFIRIRFRKRINKADVKVIRRKPVRNLDRAFNADPVRVRPYHHLVIAGLPNLFDLKISN